MPSIERVQALVTRLAPAGICDGCLAKAAGVEGRTDARFLARQLIGSDGFRRTNSTCCMCSNARAVTFKGK
jgi:hypothetical protein